MKIFQNSNTTSSEARYNSILKLGHFYIFQKTKMVAWFDIHMKPTHSYDFNL